MQISTTEGPKLESGGRQQQPIAAETGGDPPKGKFDLNVWLPVPVVHEVELLVVDGVLAAGPDPERVQRRIPASWSKHASIGRRGCAGDDN
jgi:hypothetical protein